VGLRGSQWTLRRALWRLVSGAGFSAATFASAEDELYESLAASGRSIPVIFHHRS